MQLQKCDFRGAKVLCDELMKPVNLKLQNYRPAMHAADSGTQSASNIHSITLTITSFIIYTAIGIATWS